MATMYPSDPEYNFLDCFLTYNIFCYFDYLSIENIIWVNKVILAQRRQFFKFIWQDTVCEGFFLSSFYL